MYLGCQREFSSHSCFAVGDKISRFRVCCRLSCSKDNLYLCCVTRNDLALWTNYGLGWQRREGLHSTYISTFVGEHQVWVACISQDFQSRFQFSCAMNFISWIHAFLRIWLCIKIGIGWCEFRKVPHMEGQQTLQMMRTLIVMEMLFLLIPGPP